MLKNFKLKNVALIIAVGLFSVGLHAGNVSKYVQSYADLKQLIDMTSSGSNSINFGVIYMGMNANATVTLDPMNGSIFASGTGVQLGGGATLASFAFRGTAGSVINISTSGGSLNNSSSSIPATYVASSSTVTLDDEGNGSLSVGGVLTITNNLTPGVYTGYLTVTASY